MFRNEYPYQSTSSLKDVEELKLFIENNKVTGTYNWIPAEKDKREGRLTGTVENNVIEALYTFVQEGIENSAKLKIMLDDDGAKIIGGSIESGLNSSIKKIDCNN